MQRPPTAARYTRMLACEPRKRTVPLAFLAVAGDASGHVLGGNTVDVYRTTGCRFRRVIWRTRNWGLSRVIGRKRHDHRIAQPRSHAPHIGLRVRISAFVVTKRRELGDEIILLLPGETGKSRGDAVTAWPVAGRAHMHRVGHIRGSAGSLRTWVCATARREPECGEKQRESRYHIGWMRPAPASNRGLLDHRSCRAHQNANQANANKVLLADAFVPAPS